MTVGREIDLLADYPRSQRNIAERSRTTTEDAKIAQKFDHDFFDGDRKHGYGGYFYDPKFWRPVIPRMWEHFGLTSQSSVLDVGCAKGFLLYDLTQMIPGIRVEGIDVSTYAVQNCMVDMRPFVHVGNAKRLLYPDRAFDVVLSINTIHNLRRKECLLALQEIERVKRKGAFVTVDAYRNSDERRQIFDWNLTAQTILHVDEWRELFDEAGYTGDYYWFIP